MKFAWEDTITFFYSQKQIVPMQSESWEWLWALDSLSAVLRNRLGEC